MLDAGTKSDRFKEHQAEDARQDRFIDSFQSETYRKNIAVVGEIR